MPTESDDRQQHRSLQKQYGGFYRAVSDILFRYDMMDLEGKHHTGDYDPEVDLLLLRIHEAENAEGIQGLLYQVFLNAFGEENCGSKDSYDGPAAEIWKAYERHRGK